MLELFINAFITLFVIMDPLGTAVAFTGLATHHTDAQKHHLANKAVIISLVILLFFGLFGDPFLNKLGISILSFRIAGGLLLFVVAFRMLFGHNEPQNVDDHKKDYLEREDIAVFPLAIPLLAGPGCITATILLFSKAGGAVQEGVVLVALLTVHVVALICLRLATPLQKLIGKSGTNILARVMGIILAAMSVQFMVDGILGMKLLFAKAVL